MVFDIIILYICIGIIISLLIYKDAETVFWMTCDPDIAFHQEIDIKCKDARGKWHNVYEFLYLIFTIHFVIMFAYFMVHHKEVGKNKKKFYGELPERIPYSTEVKFLKSDQSNKVFSGTIINFNILDSEKYKEHDWKDCVYLYYIESDNNILKIPDKNIIRSENDK